VIGMLFLMIVAAGLVIFMINRLYVGLSQRELNVKGAIYARDRTPFLYWSTMTMAFLALAFGVFIIVIEVAGFLEGW